MTICLTYFKSLTLEHLAAALFSVRQQNLSRVAEVVVVDNDTVDTQEAIQAVIDGLEFPIPVRLLSCKHGVESRTHSWSTNVAVRAAQTEWILFTRADYLLEFDMLARCELLSISERFVTGDCYQLFADISSCEKTTWRAAGPCALRLLPGSVATHTTIDTGVWMTTRTAFERVGGLEEGLSAWGHAQTHFQWKLHKAGVEIVRIPEVLYYHPQHGAPRDLVAANVQLAKHGLDIKELWQRYEGEHIYR